MFNKSRTKQQAATKSGLIPRPVFEPEIRHEPTITMTPHTEDDGGATGTMPVITEGEDKSAERDQDTGSRASSQ